MTLAQLRGSPDHLPDRAGDATVVRHGIDQLLEDLMERGVALLDADAAVVLLVDGSGTELVARAARCLDQEVRHGCRMHVGEGFAGGIAASGQPSTLDRVDATTVVSPVIRTQGLQALVGVPMRAGRRTIGVLQVGSMSPRRFTDDDAAALLTLADHLSVEIEALLVEADRAAAEALQRSLVPDVPTSLGAFECASRYAPAGSGGVGGDWYDVFALDDGEVWMVVGDVAGHGLAAATVMGRLRSAIRAFALIGQGPAEVLALTDRKITHFESGSLATAAVLRSAPPYDHADIALAGHPPLVLAVPGRRAELIDTEPGPPLGANFASRPGSQRVEVLAGSVVVGYTDGVVERRGESLDIGLERLRAAVMPSPPTEVCHRVMASAIGTYSTDDDAAVVVMRRR